MTAKNDYSTLKVYRHFLQTFGVPAQNLGVTGTQLVFIAAFLFKGLQTEHWQI